MTITPSAFLAFALGVSAAAVATHSLRRRSQMRRMRKLASEWRMHYSAGDCFRLAQRVAEGLPVPGAAGVRVIDLIYGVEAENYRYVFCAEYIVGVLRHKTGWQRVGTFAEPRDPAAGGKASPMILAPANLSITDQYRHLRAMLDEKKRVDAPGVHPTT